MLRKHPPGLPILFFTEMWERFGFYIVQGLLILYVTKVFGFSDSKGYAVLGAFTALAFIAPVIGGFIADQILGFRKTIIVGNVFLILGYGLLAVPGQRFLYLALAIVVTGVGLFKPTISSLLGSLYEKNDPRREAGFTIFYMGINLGVLLATTTSGFIAGKLGWNASFAFAALGLLIGLNIFLSGLKRLNHHGLTPVIQATNHTAINFFRNKTVLVIIILLMIITSWLLIDHNQMANLLLWSISAVLGLVLIYVACRYPKEARNKFLALIFLIITSIVFWGIYFQMFFSVNLFVDRIVDRHWFGFEIPTVMFIGLEGFFIFLLSPIFAYLWRVLSQRNLNPSTAFKFALATLLIGIAFIWLVVGINSSTHLVNPLWVILAYLFVTIGELLLSPIGLSTVTVLSPANLVGMMMGVWFVALGLGGKLAGVIANQSSIPQGITDPKIEALYYGHAFSHYAFYGIVVGLIILFLTPTLRTMARGENLTWKSVFSIR